MKPREFVLKSGIKILLGKNSDGNDELVKSFKGKSNVIFHTAKPGSPFCVIDSLEPSRQDLIDSAIACAAKSQDWRDNKSNVDVHQFTGKDVRKTIFMKSGSWRLKTKPKIIKVKKKEVLEWEKELAKKSKKD